jgi:urease accessory protein UreF
MITINMKDLKITKMTSEGWIQTSLKESAYYKSMCIYHRDRKAGINTPEAREIFLDYLRDMFQYDKRESVIREMSWNRFASLYELIAQIGIQEPLENEIRIDSKMEIHDGQHRLAIWYAMGNESIHINKFWNP